MNKHPKCKEKLSKERAPSLITIIDYFCNCRNNAHNVDERKCGWENEKSSPFECIQFSKVLVLRNFGCHSEICVDTHQHFEQPLKDCKQVSKNTIYHPKLLFFAPFIIPTLDHCISKIPVAKIDRNREINHKLA
jgi:hypothetical protein